MALTDTGVRALKPQERPYKVHDRNGLFLLVNPNGSKLWRRRFRFDHKEKLMALGLKCPSIKSAAALTGHNESPVIAVRVFGFPKV